MRRADANALPEHPDPHTHPHTREHGPVHTSMYPERIEKSMQNGCSEACGTDATGHATGHASTEIRDLDLCTSSTATSLGFEGTRSEERSAAAPRNSRIESSFPSPLSREPAIDGNYGVIERIAHEAFEQLKTSEPSGDVIERVKELCAKRHIDYGDQVRPDVVHRAVESAAVQRALTPVSRKNGSEPTSVGSLARGFQRQLEAMRQGRKGR